MCCVLLIAPGYSEHKCKNKFAPNARESLMKVLEAKCASIPGRRARLNDEKYDCELEQKAVEGGLSGPNGLYSFDGRSKFNGDWEKSLTEAVNNANEIDPSTYLNRVTLLMCGVPVKKIGCSIEPTKPEIAQEFYLRCNYE